MTSHPSDCCSCLDIRLSVVGLSKPGAQPRCFPHRYSSLMVYKLPVEDVRPLSQAFFKLEIGKSDCVEMRHWETGKFRSPVKPV